MITTDGFLVGKSMCFVSTVLSPPRNEFLAFIYLDKLTYYRIQSEYSRGREVTVRGVRLADHEIFKDTATEITLYQITIDRIKALEALAQILEGIPSPRSKWELLKIKPDKCDGRSVLSTIVTEEGSEYLDILDLVLLELKQEYQMSRMSMPSGFGFCNMADYGMQPSGSAA